MRKKYVLVVPFWGETHFKVWMRYGLPSYLAKNNIPYMAENSIFSILICTEKKIETLLKESVEYEILQKFCTISFLNISDIISKYTNMSYGSVLTHSYHEAIRKYKSAAYDIHFIFLNADFILADGVFKTVHQLVEKGAEIIFCPSFRVSKERILPKLDRFVKEDGNTKTLSIESREAVSLAFNHLHPTITAQTINVEDKVSSFVTNQLYWNVGEDVILGHHLLIFPFVINPKKIPQNPTGYIDYNMTYDFHPTGEITYITDSDDAFIFELETDSKEREHFTSFSKHDYNNYYNMFSKWANRLHYSNFKQLLVFHSKDIDKKDHFFNQEKIKFNFFSEQISQKFKKSMPFLNHPYWKDAILRKVSLYQKIIDSVKKFLRTTIERSSKINLEKTYFLMTDEENEGINIQNNLLNINVFDCSLAKYSEKINIYTDIRTYSFFELNNTLSSLETNKIYLFSFDKIEEKIYDTLLKYNENKISIVEDQRKHKEFICSIREINCSGKSIKRKILSVFKVIFMRTYLKYWDDYPNFELVELTLPQRKSQSICQPNRDIPIIFSTAVCGQHDVDIFLSYSLKTQLSPKNIPALRSRSDCEYRIYTLSSHKEQIETSPAYVYLRSLMPVRICEVPERENKSSIKSYLYRDNLIRAKRSNKANAFFNADMVFSNGFISKSQKILNDFKTIEIAKPKISFDKFKEYLIDPDIGEALSQSMNLQDGTTVDNRYISLPSRVLSFFSGSFLDESDDMHLFDFQHSGSFFHPSHVYWRAGNKGIVSHYFHLYPIFFNAHYDIRDDFLSIIDDDLVMKSSVKKNERFFATDPNSMFSCQLSSHVEKENTNINYLYSVDDVCCFYKNRYFLSKRLDHFMIPHVFGDLATTPYEWNIALKKANTFNKKLYNVLRDKSLKEEFLSSDETFELKKIFNSKAS